MTRFHIFYVLTILLFSASLQARDVTLGWDPVTTDSRVAAYEVHYGAASGTYTVSVTVDGVDSDTASIVGLDDGLGYFFAVRARDSDGILFSQFSNEVSITPDLNLPVPGNLRLISVTTTTTVGIQ